MYIKICILINQGEGTSYDIIFDEWYYAQHGIIGTDEKAQEGFKALYNNGYEALSK